MNKKSRSKVYDEVGKHLIECKVMGQDNDISDSPFLKNCNDCEFNIGRKLNTGKCLIYIEKDIAIMIKGRKVVLENGDSGMKPYMTKENIGRMNDIVINENMKLDNDVSDNVGYIYFRCILIAASKRVHNVRNLTSHKSYYALFFFPVCVAHKKPH
ncbi:unnamed protein product [Rhizophagus irregularis]|nr:unnamed protein product [Rhizophagus irregularis]